MATHSTEVNDQENLILQNYIENLDKKCNCINIFDFEDNTYDLVNNLLILPAKI